MGKFKINTRQEQISEQEIGRNMNFDAFMSGYTPPAGGLLKSVRLFAIAGTATAALIVAGYLLLNNPPAAPGQPALAPFINPPVDHINVPADTYVIDTETDTTLVHSTGSLIAVPQNAFITPDGKDVRGKVQLKYREFHDPIAIAMAGIPMEYDSAGKQYLLESAGMFEIEAFQDGKPLQLRPGKTLDVQLVSRTNENDYNIYYLDTVQRKWEYISENTRENNTCRPIFEIDKEKEQEFLTRYPAEKPLSEPVLPGKADPGAFSFTIDYRKEEFPELAVYDGLKFEIAETERAYDQELAQRTWDDVYVRKHEDENHYVVTFSTETESRSFTVRPVVEGKDHATAVKDFEERRARYEVLLSEKKQREQAQKDSLYRLKEEFASQAIRSNLNERFNSFISGSYSETGKDLMVYRTLYVSRLGLWNCDRPFDFNLYVRMYSSPGSGRMQEQGFYAGRFVNSSGQMLLLKNAILVLRTTNTAYPIPEKEFGSLSFYPPRVDLLIGITYDNKVVYMKDEDLRTLNVTEKIVTFKMREAGPETDTVDELRTLLKI